METKSPRRLILASSSPQRSQLLREAGYQFQAIAPSPLAESGVDNLPAAELVARLAYRKAADVASQLTDRPPAADFIVGCDTVAECGGQILGKPRDRDHAREMLRLLSDQVHRVVSGLCLWPLHSGAPEVDVAHTTLRMEALSDAEINDYLVSGLWRGKAGAFGLQDRTSWLRVVEGSESNVIGLPLELLAAMLCCNSSRDGSSKAPH